MTTPNREGQERVEVRPGVFLWLNAEDKARFEQSQAAAPEEGRVVTTPTKADAAPESASVEPTENAEQPRPRARRRR